jgi:hypothetical protein
MHSPYHGDGQFITSGGWSGEHIAWQGETGKLLCWTIGATNPERVLTLDFSPNGPNSAGYCFVGPNG